MATSDVDITEGSGLKVATNTITEDTATKHLQRVVLNESDGTEITPTTPGQASAANSLPVVQANDTPIKTRFIVATFGTITRPAATDAYAANDAVSNSTTDGSVTSQSVTISDTNDHTVSLERIRIDSTDTGVAGKAFRIWLYQSDPTASSGIVGADNEAFSTKRGTFIGTMSGTFRTFSDGSVAVCVPDEGSRLITLPTSGAKTVYALLQTLEAFTPSANSTTFILTAEGFQGIA